VNELRIRGNSIVNIARIDIVSISPPHAAEDNRLSVTDFFTDSCKLPLTKCDDMSYKPLPLHMHNMMWPVYTNEAIMKITCAAKLC